MIKPIDKYIIKKSEKKWSLNNKPQKKNYSNIICIPSYAEYNFNEPTLQSIAKQNSLLLKNTLIIIVINNSSNCNQHIIDSNNKTIQIINKYSIRLEIYYVNAFKNKYELPQKFAGVGLARKIGFDIGLNYSNINTIFYSLDADTIISNNYLKKINNYYSQKSIEAAVINFSHQKSSSINQENAIKKYEQFLKSTSLKMKKAGSPYYYHSIGSTITCKATTYASVGGMPKKKATEDFYFLQAIAKYKKIHTIKDILVYPSSRISERVYLGTGYRMKQSQNGFNIDNLNFNNLSFKILENWLKIGTKGYKKTINNIISQSKNIHSKFPDFLIKEKIELSWNGIQKSSPTEIHFINQFHRWFDALKTLKLLKTFSKQTQ